MPPAPDPEALAGGGPLLRRALESGRLNASFLLSGAGSRPRSAAEEFARGAVCRGPDRRPCGSCRDCQLSAGRSDSDRAGEGSSSVVIDGTGKNGPLYRHIGDHPDLYWVDRGAEGTRVRIGQVRALQNALRLASNEGGWRAAVIADAEWLNAGAQNALLHLLEEPPDRTCLVLVSARPAGLLATIRSRCQRAAFSQVDRPTLRGAEVDADEEIRDLAKRLDEIGQQKIAAILDWAEEYRGARAITAPRVQTLLATGSEWLRERVASGVRRPDGSEPAREVRAELEAFRTLSLCRRDLAQRNANPQMVAERALLAVRNAVSR